MKNNISKKRDTKFIKQKWSPTQTVKHEKTVEKQKENDQTTKSSRLYNTNPVATMRLESLPRFTNHQVNRLKHQPVATKASLKLKVYQLIPFFILTRFYTNRFRNLRVFTLVIIWLNCTCSLTCISTLVD